MMIWSSNQWEIPNNGVNRDPTKDFNCGCQKGNSETNHLYHVSDIPLSPNGPNYSHWYISPRSLPILPNEAWNQLHMKSQMPWGKAIKMPNVCKDIIQNLLCKLTMNKEVITNFLSNWHKWYTWGRMHHHFCQCWTISPVFTYL